MLDALKSLTLKAHGSLTSVQEQVQRLATRRDDKAREIERLKADQERYRKLVILSEKVVEAARSTVVDRFESVLTLALRTIFDDSYAFKVECAIKWNQPTAEFLVISDGLQEAVDPTNAKGGGVVDIVELGLRFALKTILGVDGPLVLDEPTEHLSGEYSENIGRFMQLLSRENGQQIVMVTHEKAFTVVADTVVQL